VFLEVTLSSAHVFQDLLLLASHFVQLVQEMSLTNVDVELLGLHTLAQLYIEVINVRRKGLLRIDQLTDVWTAFGWFAADFPSYFSGEAVAGVLHRQYNYLCG
jgi:hypothetical protein